MNLTFLGIGEKSFHGKLIIKESDVLIKGKHSLDSCYRKHHQYFNSSLNLLDAVLKLFSLSKEAFMQQKHKLRLSSPPGST